MWENLESGEDNWSEEDLLRAQVKYFEDENLKFRTMLESTQASVAICHTKLDDAEKTRQKLLKKIKSLEETAKLDKVVIDGLRAKSGIEVMIAVLFHY